MYSVYFSNFQYLFSICVHISSYFNILLACLNKDPSDDTTASVGPDAWFYAPDHLLEIQQFVDSWRGCPDLHAVDVFGASKSITRAFKRKLYKAEAWDIAIDRRDDIVTESGFYGLLHLCLRLFLECMFFFNNFPNSH